MSEHKQNEDEKFIPLAVVLFFALLLVIAWAHYYWDEIVEFFHDALWIVFLLFIILSVLSITIWALNRYGVINFHPLSGRSRRFKKWHLITRIAAYFANPDRLSTAAENLEHLEEINTKLENRSSTNMQLELDDARIDYEIALQHCKTKDDRRDIKQKYLKQRARIREKYMHE